MEHPQFIQIQNLSFEDYWKKITEIVELVVKKHLSKEQHQTTTKETLLSRNQASSHFGITPPTLDSWERDKRKKIFQAFRIKPGINQFK